MAIGSLKKSWNGMMGGGDRKETQDSQDSLNMILILAAYPLCALGMPSFMLGSEHSERLYKEVGDFWRDQQLGPHPPEDSITCSLLALPPPPAR